MKYKSTRSSYNKEADKELFGETVKFETTQLKVGVYSYNDGDTKLQISRENLDPMTGKFTWSKLGRMVKPEVEAVIPLMQKAIEHMKEPTEMKEE